MKKKSHGVWINLRVVESVVPVLAKRAVKPSLFAIYMREQLRAIVARYPIPLGRIQQDTLAVYISVGISTGLYSIGIVHLGVK